MSEAQQVYIGIGSNLDSPIEQVRLAIDRLRALASSNFECSPLYQTRPVGPQDQPDYINAVAGFVTEFPPEVLLNHLQQIEIERGRQRKAEQWGPRTLDLDILLYGKQTMCDDRLTIPHPHMHERGFVLQPLSDIAPGCEVPGLGSVDVLLGKVDLKGIQKIHVET